MNSLKALNMANNLITLLMKKIKNHEDGYWIETFHYDQCKVNENQVILVGNGTVIIRENFFSEGVSSSGIGHINKNSVGTDYGWMLQIGNTRAFVDCDRCVHVWEQEFRNGEHGPVYHVEHQSLTEASKVFLNELEGGDDTIQQNNVVISFVND